MPCWSGSGTRMRSPSRVRKLTIDEPLDVDPRRGDRHEPGALPVIVRVHGPREEAGSDAEQGNEHAREEHA